MYTDVLSKSTLKTILLGGCRVLNLSSDVSLRSKLCAETEFGEMEVLELAWLQNVARSRITIDVVLLNIPQSKKLGQQFVRLGVPHVVCFDFSLLTSSDASGGHGFD